MNLSRNSRAAIISTVVAATLGWLVLVDLGVNAGQIHYGVRASRGYSVGGMTEEEAGAALVERMELAGSNTLILSSAGIRVRVKPIRDLGWRPRPIATAHQAMRVGRDGTLLVALANRARAWFGAVTVPWQGGFNPRRVSGFINRVEDEVTDAGHDLDRAKLRGKIKRLSVQWPRRRWYRLPVLIN